MRNSCLDLAAFSAYLASQKGRQFGRRGPVDRAMAWTRWPATFPSACKPGASGRCHRKSRVQISGLCSSWERIALPWRGRSPVPMTRSLVQVIRLRHLLDTPTRWWSCRILTVPTPSCPEQTTSKLMWLVCTLHDRSTDCQMPSTKPLL